MLLNAPALVFFAACVKEFIPPTYFYSQPLPSSERGIGGGACNPARMALYYIPY